MKRKLIYISFSYALGLFFASIYLSPEKYALPLILSAFLIFFSFCKASEKNLKEIIFMIIPFFIAFGVYSFYNCYVYETLLKWDSTEGYFSGEIIDISDYANDNSRYILDGTIDDIIEAKIICYNTSYNCEIGDKMSFECEFKKPDGDYLFNTAEFYKPEKIYLSADKIQNTEIIKNDKFCLKKILYDYRKKMITQFRLNTDRETSAFLSAMIFGDKSEMEDSSKTLLYRSGIGHIMAISGIHVSICAGFLMLILKKLRLNKFISFGIICIFLILMIIIVGSPASVIRASIMLAILYGSDLFFRQNDTFNSLAAAVLLICISNPFIIYSQGFLMSISGTYGIGVLAPYMTKNIDSKIIKSFMSMFYVSVCVLPLSIIYFDEVSIISPITNIILIPLCSIVLITGLIFVLSGGFLNLLFTAKYPVKIISFITSLAGQNSAAYINGDSKIFVFLIIIFISGFAAYIIFKNRKSINIIIALGFIFIAGYNILYTALEKDTLKIAFLGRNQNLSLVLNYNGNTDIIDLSGHYKSPDYVRKYLSRNHINNINNLLITKKSASSESSYKSAMQLNNIKNIYSCSSEEIKIKYKNYIIEYHDSIVDISFGKYSVCVSPYKYSGTADIFVFYGKSKNIDLNGSYIIYNKNFNNFCINLSENSFKIRRLQNA